jgi:sec-independent protein translocase protein TatA
MGSLSPTHWIIVLIVAAILFFGWKQLPDMARSAGKSLRIFKTEMKGLADDDKAREAHTTEQAPPQSTAPVAPPAVGSAPPVTPSAPTLPPSPQAAVPPAAAPPTQPASGGQPSAPDNQPPRAE